MVDYDGWNPEFAPAFDDRVKMKLVSERVEAKQGDRYFILLEGNFVSNIPIHIYMSSPTEHNESFQTLLGRGYYWTPQYGFAALSHEKPDSILMIPEDGEWIFHGAIPEGTSLIIGIS